MHIYTSCRQYIKDDTCARSSEMMAGCARRLGKNEVVICIEVNQLVDHVSLRSFFFFQVYSFTRSFARFMFAYVSTRIDLFHTWS